MSNSNDSNTIVTVGGRNYTIERFRGLKAILMFASLSRITRDVPDLVSDAAKAYGKRNTVDITEDMARLPRWEGFSKEDFDRAEQETGERVLHLPSTPNGNEALLVALPDLLESTARREVVRLFAILLIPNDELRDADKSDRVNEALDQYRDLILYEAEIDELIELGSAARLAIVQLSPAQKVRLGNMMRGLLRSLGISLPDSMTRSSEQTPQTNSSTPQTLTDDAQISSTDSELDTDGAETPRSTVPLGVN
jgi:hypothetical protein